MEGEVVQENAQAPQKHGLFGLHTIIYLALFFVPTFVIPLSVVPFQYSKTLLVLIATVIVASALLYIGFKKSNIRLTWSPLLLSLWGLPLAYLIASIFSQSPSLSFFGYQLDIDTFGFMTLGAFTATVVAAALSHERLMGALKAFGVGALIVFLFQLIQVLFGAPLPLATLGDPIVNLVGRWNDFGVFAGLVGLLSLLAYSTMPLKAWHKVVLAVTFVVSIFFLALVSVNEIWILFGVISFALLIILTLRAVRDRNAARFSAVLLSGLGVAAAIIFFFFGGLAANLQTTFAINSLEVRPSLEGTTDILREVYANEPIVGSGPNTFASNWLLDRPDAVLNTIFWNTPFNTGSGMIPTAFVGGGVLVLIAWLVFSLLILYTLVRALFTAPLSGKSYTVTVFSALAVFYLLIVQYIFAPSQSIVLLFFLLLGVFLASLRGTTLMRELPISLEAPGLRQAYVVGAVVIMLVSLYAVYGTARTYASSVYHERAVQTANQGDIDGGRALIGTALTLQEQDRYYRTSALISLAKMNQIINENAEVTDETRTAFQSELVQAIEATTRAVEIDDTAYANWITRALIYANVVPLGIDGAFENAALTLEEARARNPKSPEVDYRLAEIHLATNDQESARTFLQAAIQKKQNYTNAVLLLAQLELNAGNLGEAIESVRSLVFFDPQNPVLLYQLGILLLQDQNYEEAALAFEAALGQQNDYANAAFFLAQSYAFLDRIDEAAQLMGQLAALNPDNELVVQYAADLFDGTNPFAPGEVATPEDEEEVVQ